MRCPGCEMNVVTEESFNASGKVAHEENPVKQSNSSVSALKAVAEEVGNDEEEDGVDVPQTYEEMRKEYDRKNKRMEHVSAKLGEHMLQGWTMLGCSCPNSQCSGTPLMSSPDDKLHYICVCCNERFRESEDGSGELVPLIPHVHHEPVIVDDDVDSELVLVNTESATKSNHDATSASYSSLHDISNAPLLPKREEAVDSSTLIAKRLLQGWALLDKLCYSDSCHGSVPLMRDHSGKVRYCRQN